MTARRRKIAVVTVARSDFGIYEPILRALRDEPSVETQLIVTGTHLSPEFGLTRKSIEAAGHPIAATVEMLLSSDTTEGAAKSIGLGVLGLAQEYARLRPDLLLVLGDRTEMLSAVVAALPQTIPIAHLHGGDVTEGAIDDAIRHAITKMSHLHFVATDVARRRVEQMGEEPWRVTVSGAPGLDNLRAVPLLSREEVEARLDMSLERPTLLVTFHPVTLEGNEAGAHIRELLAAVEASGLPSLFTYPSADAEGRVIIEAIEAFVARRTDARVVQSLGTSMYFSMMKHSAAMIGNSSSGIIEAASLELPVLNVGNRQRGRLHGPNVVDVPCTRDAIADGIRRVVAPSFRAGLRGMVNPYGDGRATGRIVDVLRSTPLDQRLMWKRFCDLGSAPT
jgi:UDP-N-acetylglucosamine 2-epimerase (non-hydrolysing)/GDP/UDP-N,N'-diacetylbacillosamine 2-epimerase (hydrolysing)